MQKVNLDSAPANTFGKVSTQVASLENAKVIRVVINPGGSWSNDLKQHAGTDSCKSSHTGIVLSGTMAVKTDDGIEEHFSKNDIAFVPPGHDTWCVGDEPVVYVEWRME